MNPEAPCIHGTIKFHEQNKPVRPIVNWKNSPGYKTATQLTKKLKKNMIQLPNTFNMQNSKELMHRLQETNTQGNIKLCSFDITNMYSNIPQKELIQVIDNALQNNNVNTEQKHEVILLVNTILK
jgi:hypothetical protein